jgi:hypothetical protein
LQRNDFLPWILQLIQRLWREPRVVRDLLNRFYLIC